MGRTRSGTGSQLVIVYILSKLQSLVSLRFIKIDQKKLTKKKSLCLSTSFTIQELISPKNQSEKDIIEDENKQDIKSFIDLLTCTRQ